MKYIYTSQEILSMFNEEANFSTEEFNTSLYVESWVLYDFSE